MQQTVVTAFIHTLLDGQQPCFAKQEDSLSNETLQKIFDTSNSQLWDALMAALDVEQEHKLSVIVDGVDNVENQKSEFIAALHALVAYLLGRPLQPKILLTSRSQADAKQILDEPLCIEYDKERKGSITFQFLTY
jgi:hypothetical protein